MKNLIYLTILLTLGAFTNTSAQEIITKDLCINLYEIDPSGYNVFDDDGPFQMGQFPQIFGDSPCYFFQGATLFIVADEMCCDTFLIQYEYLDSPDLYQINLVIKCNPPVPKPDCTNINLSEIDTDPVGGPGSNGKVTLYACDETLVTYYVDEAPGQTITWDAGPVPVVQSPDNVGQVIWPSPGSYSLTVTIGTTSTTYCIEVLESPTADFAIAGSCGCLNTPIDFMSTGIGGNTFFWDFGDGMFGSGENVTHEYTGPGIYNVTLIVIQDNFDDKMNPLCCCADTISMPIEILNLEGPDIFWISTLCEGDTTKYWTDAVGCTYLWTAVDSGGANVLPLGTITTNDTLCVPWGNGPFGAVSLTVSGCTNNTYCPKPTTAIIPIIEANSTITGEDTVCLGSSEFYTVPKWPTVQYDWMIVPPSAGSIISGNGTNSVNIIWSNTATSATLIVNYYSDFLGGIVGHEPEDCSGSAELDITILPKFELKTPIESKFCINDTINFTAGPISPSTTYPLNFIWEVEPPVGPITTITLPGTSPYLTSYSVPGYYFIKVYPSIPNPYCNDTVYKQIEIIEVPPMDGIDGPKEVCPNDTVSYFGLSSMAGTEFYWSVSGGSIIGPNTGNPVTIAWDNTGPYFITVYQEQINPPNCPSDPITCPIAKKELDPSYTIIGPPACINEVMTYSLSPIPTDPDVSYNWTIISSTDGSVIAGDTGPVVDIQWNNTAGSVTIQCTISLCDEIKIATTNLNLSEAAVVIITQNMPYCIGAVGVTLTASTSGASYNWSTPSPPPAILNAQSVNVTAPGNYVVTVTETNGCTAVANYEVFENGLPNVNLTSPNILSLCIQDVGNTVDLHALVGAYSYQWYKSTNGGSYVLNTETSAILTHTNSGILGYCNYYYVATDLISLCSDQSNTLLVTQSDCSGSGGGCIPETYTTNVTSSPSLPSCNEINFTTSNSINVNITGWDFNDPSMSNAYTGPPTAPTYTFTEAGYYVVYMYGTVPNVGNTSLCTISDTNAVCIPLAADFDFIYDCGKFTFTSTSTHITGAAPNMWNWNFGDTNSGSGMTIMHTYNVTFTTVYTVTLTISNPAGCTSTITKNITVYPPPTADIIALPMDTCVNKPFAFSNANNAGIVGWDWQFGDSSSNGASDPLHSYGTDGTYMVTLTVTDENGCTNSDVKSIVVHPAAITGPITWLDDLFLCPGESLVLNAPAGNQFLWSTGDITPSITVMTTGTFGVTVTDINGCTFIPDSVDVVVYPEIDATISGSNVICDDGCTTLYAVSAAGYTYLWEDNLGSPIPSMGAGNSIEICFDDGITSVMLTITDANMCVATDTITIEYYNSPDVLITPSNPILCAGTPNTLTASTTYPNPVVFNWNTGVTGPSINVILEGTYYVTVTDPVTGCSQDTFININPIPDLCLVPYGCYTACDPDTICAPPGLSSYEWYFQGVLQPMYSGLECIIVTESGAYNFAGTNEFNCEAISDTLYLEMIPCCKPGDTEITASPVQAEGNCCYIFDYNLSQDIFYALDLHSNDADLGLNLGSVDPLLGITSSLPSINSFKNATSGTPLPSSVPGFAIICLEDAINNPVEVIVDWRGEDGEILCSDTLYLECEVEPDCIYVQSDSIYCGPNGQLLYDVTICNPADALYSIGYIDFIELSPAGVMLNPSEIDLGAGVLMPGDCISFTLNVLGSGLANQTLCYKLVGHEFNPDEVEGALCCSSETNNYIFIPGCTPCDMVYVSGIDSSDMGECCYDVTVNNYFSDADCIGIDLCVLTAGATFDIFNPGSSPWDITGLTSTTANLDYNDGAISFIPFGDTPLPTICVGDNESPYVDIEIKWISSDGSIKCRDTISLLCPGECGYMSETSLDCGPNGTWIFSGYITNTSQFIMDNAFIDFGEDILNAYDTNINLNGLAPNDTYGPFNIVLSGTSGVGPELCIITTLHANDHNDEHEDCCQFKTVIEVPDCGNSIDCKCSPLFEEEVGLGINCNQIFGTFTFIFSPAGNFGDCDKVIWDFQDSQTANMTQGNQSVSHTYTGPGEYTVCMTIIRTQLDGKQCKEKFCKDVFVSENGLISVFPNPVTDQVNIAPENTSFNGMATIEIIDASNRLCKSLKLEVSDDIITSIDVDDFKTGVYMIRINLDNEIHTKRIIIVK